MKKNLMDLNIQLFAEDVAKAEETFDKDEILTFDEILKDKTYQSEFDKKVSKAIETAKIKWEKEAEMKKTEAEKLAQMSAEDKSKYEIAKANEKAEKAVAELNSYKLKEEAQKIAKEKELDLSLLDILDFSKETAETIKEKIENVNNTFNKAVENKVNEKLRERNPRQVYSGGIDTDKEYLKEKYKNNPYYKG